MENLEIPKNWFEMPIGSEVSIKDNNWEILKRFAIKENDIVKTYGFLIQCKKCGFKKLVNYSTLYSKYVKCEMCFKLSRIGTIAGPYKIIKYDYSKDKKDFYTVECIHCHRQYSGKRYDTSTLKKWNKCIHCDSATDDPGINIWYTSYKYGAKNRNLEFNLSIEDFLDLIKKPCVYCGQPAPERTVSAHKKNSYNIIAQGIDRIDSSKGYSKENCVPCCTICNRMKLDLSKTEFLDKISQIYNFSIEKRSTTIEKTSEEDGTE